MRLIDADREIRRLQGKCVQCRDYDSCTGCNNDKIIDEFRKAQTVDIKTEVAREIFAEIEKIIYRYLNDTIYSMGEMIYDLNELKNKYTKEGDK